MVITARRPPLEFQLPVAEDLERVDALVQGLFESSGGLIGEVSRHVLASNGKRVRPTLLLLAARAGAAASPATILAAGVVELIHMATLIHDDSVDRSMLRRGLPTINSMYSDQVSVIMGDFVYSKAFAMMMEEGLFEEMTILSMTAHVMSRGEMHQLERKNQLAATEEACMEVIDEKTASLFAAACRIGALLRDGSDRQAPERRAQQELWAEFGLHYGRAFQITDDLFDFIGEQAVMGKATGSDIRGGRVTLPLVAALGVATPRQRARIGEIVGDGVHEAQWPELVDFIERQGGVDYSYERAAHHADQARRVADHLDLDDACRAALLDAVQHVVRRRR